MSTKLLSSLVQTKSIELVLAPIASQVSQLIILNEAGERDGIPVPYLVSNANQICEAIRSLVLVAEKLILESADDEFKVAISLACNEVTNAGRALQIATQQLNREPFSHAVRYSMVDAARNILEGTMKVLLVYDQAEVRKIVRAAHWVMDRLGLVEAVTSIKGFVVSFKGFTESLMLLASLCDKRQRELSNPRQRDRLLSAMAILKKSVALLSSTMKTYLRQPNNTQAKASRDYVIGQIKLACTEIIRTVEAQEDDLSDQVPPAGQLASTLRKAQHQLLRNTRLNNTSELDCYLDAIIRSSMAVANTVEGLKREKIVIAGQIVLQTRNELSEFQKLIMSNPNALTERRQFDMTVERLNGELQRLDRHVTLAIADQVSSVFSDVELPVHQLVSAATEPLRERNAFGQEQAMLNVRHKADEFHRHVAKLSQVSKHAASVSSDVGKVHVITSTCAELEKLVPQVVAAAIAVRRNPRDGGAVDRLRLLRHDWGKRLVILADAVDDVTDIRDFIDVTELNIQKDIARCHEALSEGNAAKLAQASRAVLGQARRVVHVGKRDMTKTSDPIFKGKLQSQSGELEKVIPSLDLAVEEAICNMSDTSLHGSIAEAMRSVMEKIRTLKASFKRESAPDAADLLDFTDAPREPIEGPLSAAEFPNQAWEQFESAASDKLSSDDGASDEQGITLLRDTQVPPVHEERQSDPQAQFHSDTLLSALADDSHVPPPVSFPAKLPQTDRSSARLLQQLERKHVSSTWNAANSLTEDGRAVDELADRLSFLGLNGADPLHMTSFANILGRHVVPSRGSRAPVTSLIRTAKAGNLRAIEAPISELVAKAGRIATLADKMAEKCHDADKVRQVRITSTELRKLTPMIAQAARDVTTNPRDVIAVERLHTIGREWASKLHVLVRAVDEMVSPWSASASKLALAATSGDRHELRKQVDNINGHVGRLSQLALSAKTAADAEDYSVDAGNDNDVTSSRDPASIQRVDRVQVMSQEVREMTSLLVEAAENMVVEPTDLPSVDTVENMRREWACKVNSLVLAVDDITVGTSAPVEQLAQAAMSSDHHALQERLRLVTSYTRTLKEMAAAATAGCRDHTKVAQVENTITAVERITADLLDTARIVTDLSLRSDRTVEQNLALMSIVEKMDLSRREWAAKVHLLTALVDDLTAEVSAPVDRLAGAALAVSRADLTVHARQEQDFDTQAQELSNRVARVRTNASRAVEKSANGSRVRTVRVTGDFIDRLTPQVIVAARSLADNPDQTTVEYFQMLRRQWASKAQLLMATLEELSHGNLPAVQSVIQDLLGGVSMDAAASFESLTEDDTAAITGSSRLFTPSPTRDPIPSRLTAPSPTRDPTPSRLTTLSPARDPIPSRFTAPSPTRDPIASRFTAPFPTRDTIASRFTAPSPTRDPIPSRFTAPSPTRDPIPSRFTKPRRTPSPQRKPPAPLVKEPRIRKKEPSLAATSVDDIEIGRKRTSAMDRSLSDTEAFVDTKPRVPIGASSSETDIRKALVDELHQRFSSNESLNRSKWDARYWAKFEIERKRHQRAASMSDLRRAEPEWRSESIEDLRARKNSKSIALAAKILQEEAEQWAEENNSIVQVAKKMAHQMMKIAQFARHRGKSQNKMEMINTTKAIAENGKVILKFAHVLANQCVDERSRKDLLYYAEYIPTMSTQLKIISSVKAATPSDLSADAMLVRNAENLMQAVVKTLKAAEAASVKGLVPNLGGMSADHAEAAELAFQWKRKLQRQRAIEALTASRDHLGLRRRGIKQSTPSLADIVHV